MDGNDYIDYVCSWGAVLAGHAHPVVVEAIRAATGHGTTFGAPTELEVELAELGDLSALIQSHRDAPGRRPEACQAAAEAAKVERF